MEKLTMSHSHNLQTAKTLFYMWIFWFSSRVNSRIWNLICSGNRDLPKNWERKGGKSENGKVRNLSCSDSFHIYLLLWMLLQETWTQNSSVFASICKSLWQISQTDTIKLRMNKLLQQWHFWYFSVYIERVQFMWSTGKEDWG